MFNQLKSHRSQRQTFVCSFTTAVALIISCHLTGSTARAANVLANASMESGLTAGWTCYGRTGQEGWYSYALASVPDPTVTGNNSFKVYAGWNGDPNFSGIYQNAACLPTSVFTANAWFRTKSGDKIAGTYGGGGADDGNICWAEVTFRDAADNVLALYKSAVFDGAWDADVWFAMPITNECDIANGVPTNSVATLVAPTGTTKARYQIVLKQSQWHGGGALWVDDMVLNQVSGPTAPGIGNLSPGSILMANAANGISFTASSASGTTIDATNIQVTVNGSNVSSGLVITGSASSKNVSYSGLQSNQTYAVSIQVTDALALSTSASLNFDTWSPLYLWEGEDYDFNGGQFLDNPVLSSTAQASSYFGQVGFQDVDMHETTGEGDHLYRVSDTLATTVSGDAPRQKFLSAQTTDPAINDYKVGWFNGGEWVNFTRTFPAGTYNVYGRLAGGAGAATMTLGKVTDGWGTSTQTITNLGTFSFVGTGWSTFQYVPLTDANGNLVAVTLSGTNTLRVTTGGGGDLNFVMLTAVDTNRPVINAVYPNGTTLMQKTNTLSFEASSPGAGINNGGIQLVVNGVDVSSSLVIGGSANSKTVSYAGLLPNVPSYTAIISVTNANGLSTSTTVHFDTFSPNHYTWEAEDYDYDGGKFIDNPQLDGYLELNPIQDVDVHEIGFNGAIGYRSADGIGTDVTGDLARTRFAGTNDYNVGWYGAGEWLNYTRTFPAGNYLVYGRFARGTGTNAAPMLSRVTDGWGTTTQTTVDLGSFSVDSHGWGSYAWSPLRDGSGNTVKLALNGGTNTFRLTSAGPEGNTEVNANFLMLVPVATPGLISATLSGGNIVLSFPTESGFSYQVQHKGNLTDSSWNNLGNAVAGDGTSKSVSDPATGVKRFYRLEIQ